MAVNRSLRDSLAGDIIAFLSGKLTNDELLFENPNWGAYESSEDIAIGRISQELWIWFDDARLTFRLRDEYALEPHERELLERCVLFLWSDEIYQYPDGTHGCGWMIVYLVLTSITLGWYSRWFERRMSETGDRGSWPFTDASVVARERKRLYQRFQQALGPSGFVE